MPRRSGTLSCGACDALASALADNCAFFTTGTTAKKGLLKNSFLTARFTHRGIEKMFGPFSIPFSDS